VSAAFRVPARQDSREHDADEHDDHGQAGDEADALPTSKALDPTLKSWSFATLPGGSVVPRSLLAHLSLFPRLLVSRFTGAKVAETEHEMGDPRRHERDRRALLARETLQEVAGLAAR
jgi:hypothetical protein